jgi:hypothetical protein
MQFINMPSSLLFDNSEEVVTEQLTQPMVPELQVEFPQNVEPFRRKFLTWNKATVPKHAK